MAGWEDTIQPIQAQPAQAKAASWEDTIKPIEAAAPKEDPHDLVPFLKNTASEAWDKAKDVVSHPIDTMDRMAGNAIETFTPTDYGPGPARKITDREFDDSVQKSANSAPAPMPGMASALQVAGTVMADAYLHSRKSGNDPMTAAKDARNIGVFLGLTHGAGAAIPAVAAGAGKAGAAAGEAAGDFAENRAASALGMTKGIRNRIGNDAANQAGRVGLDEGVIKPWSSTEGKISGMQAVQDKAGQQVGGVMDQLDNAGVKQFTPGDVAMQVDSDLGPTYHGEPLFKGQASQYDNLIDTILKRGAEPISFADAQSLKQMLGQYAFKEGAGVVGKEQAQRAYGIVNRELDNAVQAGAKTLPNSPELLDTLQKAKTNYGASKNAMTGLENKLSAEQGNRYFGLSDMITGSASAVGAGLAHGGPMAAAAGVGTLIVKKGLEKFGQNTAAWGANKVSNLLKTSPQALGKYAPVLQEAEQRGSLAVTHYLMSERDPGYRAVIGDSDEDGAEDVPQAH